MGNLMSDLDRLLAGADAKVSEMEELTLPSDATEKETKEPDENDLIDMVAEVTKMRENIQTRSAELIAKAVSSLDPPKATDSSNPPKKHGRKGPRGKYACKVCGELGHNARTCTKKVVS